MTFTSMARDRNELVLQSGKETDFALAKDYVMVALDRAMQLEKENELLRSELKVMQAEFFRLRRIVREQQRQNALLRAEWQELVEPDGVVTLDSVVGYALRQSEPWLVRGIVNMLNSLFVKRGFVPEALLMKVEELEGHILRLETPRPVVHHNHGCQNFYGDISESDFSSNKNSKKR